MSSNSDIDLLPKDLLNADGNLILQHQDVLDLLKYVWTGVLLPVTEAQYKSRLQISDNTANKLTGVIEPLVEAYATAQDHCRNFKDVTYPSIVDTASDIYHYAQNAGGTVDSSYYAYIVQCIKDLDNAQTQSEQQSLRETIKALIDMEVDKISAIQKKAQDAVDTLRQFEQDTKVDQSTLKDRSTAVHDKVTSEVGSLSDLGDKLKEYREELTADIKEYEHDKLVACTTPSYAWLGLIGLISASVVAGIYGDKAAKMARRIDEVKELISDYEGKVRDETRLVADLGAINRDLSNVLNLIEPTCQVIENMIGAWTSIASDLTNLQTMVDTDLRGAIAAIAGHVELNIVSAWNTLGKRADAFRQAAFVSDAEQATLDDLANQLREQAKE
ncbi:hypothetical protein EV715DRAFT_197329 [Schizophyllum commune]